MMTAEVAVLASLPGPYTYLVPPALAAAMRVGTRVWVPFSAQRIEGVVLALPTGAPAQRELRAVLQIIDSPPLPADLLAVARFIADYYQVPTGDALRLVLPPGSEARSAQRLTLTPEGRAQAPHLDDALLPPALAALSGHALLLWRGVAALTGSAAQQKRAEAGTVLLARVLTWLAGQPGGRPKDLIPSAVQRALGELQRAGLLSESEHIAAGQAPRREALVHARPGPLSEEEERALRRRPSQSALLTRLRDVGSLPLSVLRREFPGAPLHVKALVSAGLCTLDHKEVFRDPLAGRWQALLQAGTSFSGPAEPPALTSAQDVALRALLAALPAEGQEPGAAAAPGAVDDRDYAGFLLHGVTGSGKTEVYLRLIAEVLRRGRTALVLVPEIGLTPQLSARFRARFGDDVAVLHSALSSGERADAWRRLARGDLRIALGPRSALFAPLSRLGVVIVDEEHDGSFKQQEGVRYHGRDVALVRARAAGALAVLGSATPSLEALAMAHSGKLTCLRLPERATGQILPVVQIIDLRQHLLPEDGLLSAPLVTALAETLMLREQSILFLNRRGYATFLLCRVCGHRFECAHCAVTLTWHKGQEHLLCHYCGYSERLPQRCPKCTADKIERLGIGTERIEEQVALRFPTARVARLDRDSASGEGLAQVLAAMHQRQIDILIGTQMLAKGHDFPGVTLVGVVLADTGIGLPDFRAAERTFQLLAQVAGRAGRADRPGRVLIQTYNPKHPAIVCACTHDYHGFAEGELRAREELRYPPFSRLSALRLDGEDPAEVRAAAERVAQAARAVMARAPSDAQLALLGPAEAPLSRLKGRTRWQVFVRSRSPRALRTVVSAAQRVELPAGVRLSLDVDPVSTL